MSERRDAELQQDILEAIRRIEDYTNEMTYETFLVDTRTQDPFVRNLEILGEAVKKLSPQFTNSHPSIEWNNIAGMRDRLIHDYFGVNWEIVWDVIGTKLPALKTALGCE